MVSSSCTVVILSLSSVSILLLIYRPSFRNNAVFTPTPDNTEQACCRLTTESKTVELKTHGATTEKVGTCTFNDKVSVNKTTPNPTKYVTFPGLEPFDRRCNSCAFVTNSGHMTGSNLGTVIDSHECVIRSNDGPTAGFENDVGNKTTVRTVDFRSLQFIMRRLKDRTAGPFDEHFPEETVVVVYEYLERMGKTLKLSQEYLRLYPKIKFATFTTKQWCDLRSVYRSRVAELVEEIWITNGFSSLMLMREMCDEIHIYGMADAEYCQREKPGDRVRYHYYDNKGYECDVFNRHAKAQTWAHRFLKEKKFFGECAQEWGNLFFHHPDWPVTRA